MRTNYTISEIAFLVDLAELCERHKVKLQPAGWGRHDFVGLRLHFKIDDDFAIAIENEQARAHACAKTHGRPGDRGANDKAIHAALATLALYGFDLSIGADDDQMQINVPDELLSSVKGYVALLPDRRRSRAAFQLKPATLTVTKTDGTVE